MQDLWAFMSPTTVATVCQTLKLRLWAIEIGEGSEGFRRYPLVYRRQRSQKFFWLRAN
jgi:hypothetical protein